MELISKKRKREIVELAILLLESGEEMFICEALGYHLNRSVVHEYFRDLLENFTNYKSWDNTYQGVDKCDSVWSWILIDGHNYFIPNILFRIDGEWYMDKKSTQLRIWVLKEYLKTLQ